jgi:hypothetical protein
VICSDLSVWLGLERLPQASIDDGSDPAELLE